jgi:hypothetical protein
MITRHIKDDDEGTARYTYCLDRNMLIHEYGRGKVCGNCNINCGKDRKYFRQHSVRYVMFAGDNIFCEIDNVTGESQMYESIDLSTLSAKDLIHVKECEHVG